jgi:hypothetical protein
VLFFAGNLVLLRKKKLFAIIFMNLFRRIFGNTTRSKALDNDFDYSQRPVSLADFIKLSDDHKIITIIRLRTAPADLNNFSIFQYAILSDTHPNVKFAALKRIHFFKDHPELIPMINKIREDNNYRTLEPYFSMALSRLGLISQDDLKRILGAND